MSDSLGDGTGHPTSRQVALYSNWAAGGIAASIIGEVQATSNFAEKPGNLVLNEKSDRPRFQKLAKAGTQNDSLLFLQLGHAGALAFEQTSRPAGPSALNLPELKCSELSLEAIHSLPEEFAKTAALAKAAGFGGVQIHAAHGFLLSQFLSPLFNQRKDEYGGSIENRMRLLLETTAKVRASVGAGFPIAVKLNSSDQLKGGLTETDALQVVKALDQTSIDIIDISGGTYFPGAKSASDAAGKGPYFLGFAKQSRQLTDKPIMLTGGFKTKYQAEDALSQGVDIVGLARLMILEPDLPNHWQNGSLSAPEFPRFTHTPEGGVTAWYTMQMSMIADGNSKVRDTDIDAAIRAYEDRDAERTRIWKKLFPNPI